MSSADAAPGGRPRRPGSPGTPGRQGDVALGGPRVTLPSMTRAAPLICLATAVIIWATTFVVSSSALATTSPAVLTVLRFALAAIVLVPLALRRGGMGR